MFIVLPNHFPFVKTESGDWVPKHILIADDSAMLRKTMRTALEKQTDWQVCEACDGREAIEQAKILKPDVVFITEINQLLLEKEERLVRERSADKPSA